MNIHEMVDAIGVVMLKELGVVVDKFKVTDALDSDLAQNGIRRLSLEEIDQFAMGDEETGKIPELLLERYPNLHALLMSYI